jgi:hypothetical protein
MFGRQDCARQAHNLKVVSSNLAPATNKPLKSQVDFEGFPFCNSEIHSLGHSWGTAEREFAGRFGGPIFLWIIFSEGENRCALDKFLDLTLD